MTRASGRVHAITGQWKPNVSDRSEQLFTVDRIQIPPKIGEIRMWINFPLDKMTIVTLFLSRFSQTAFKQMKSTGHCDGLLLLAK